MDARLPHGAIVEGQVHRVVGLRPLTGKDEEFLLHEGSGMPPAERDTAVLARCITNLGPDRAVTADQIRALCVGDRQALLLQLCAAATGSVLESVVTCGNDACEDQLEVAVEVGPLLEQPCPDAAETHDVMLGEAVGDPVNVRLRIPDGALEEAASRLDADDAERMLVDAVVCQVLRDGEALPRLPDGLEDELSVAVERLDPLAEIRLEVLCPSCGTTSVALLDAGDYLLRQVSSNRASFYAEVHVLASRYHWSESEILGLPVPKRRLYVGLIESADTEVWA